DRILATAGDDGPRLDWPAIERALAERQGYPIRITGGAAESAPAGTSIPAPAEPALAQPVTTQTAAFPR
ncbi:MAG TPA: hypothetical protein VES39_03580, partial [Rhodospirillales bacterium]|nr:hypothetical protein [Rhodospirillales bacterium]